MVGFETCCGCVNEVLNRPFGGLVFASLWLACIECWCVVIALGNQEELTQCEFPSETPKKIGIKTWLYIQAVCAIVNFAFAPYLQNHLWTRLLEQAKEVDDPNKGITKRTEENREDLGSIRVSQHDLKNAFTAPDIACYSVLVVLSFVWSLMGWLWILRMGPWSPPAGHVRAEQQICNPGAFGDSFGAPAWAARTGMFFFVFFVTYLIAWAISIALMQQDEALLMRKRLPGYEEVSQEDNQQSNSGGWFFGGGGNNNSPATPSGTPDTQKPSKGRTFAKLVASVGVDALGMSTYALPGVGEVGDVVFAPASAVMLKMMYNANGIAAVGLVEEILPGTDVVPTATIAWGLETFAPNSFLTRGFGINPNSWNLTGSGQK